VNVETGQLYEGLAAIRAAEERGEPLAQVSPMVVKTMRAGQRAQAKAKAKGKRKQARQDRKRSRQ
jgi:hypothetical protein